MSHEAPAAPGALSRVAAAARYVLTMEPVAVAAVWRAVVVLLGAAGVTVGTELDGRVVAVIAALYALVELLTTLRARGHVYPEAKVVQAVQTDGRVVAGPASPLPTGSVVGTAAGRSIFPTE